VIIFDTKTYAELGVKGGSALLKLTIVRGPSLRSANARIKIAVATSGRYASGPTGGNVS